MCANVNVTVFLESKRLHDKGICESLDCCVMAYLHEALTEGDRDRLDGFDHQPLYRAIQESSNEDQNERATLGKATDEQVARAAGWFADWFYWNVFQVSKHLGKEGQAHVDVFAREIKAMATNVRSLFLSRNFYHTNLFRLEEASKLVQRLVRLDRLPNANSLQGLHILRDAWCDVDVAMHLASRYKLLCKALFFVQLAFGWLMVGGAVLGASDSSSWHDELGDGWVGDVVRRGASTGQQSVFIIGIMLTAVVSMEGLLNPRSRWRQLRNGAITLESLIWQYRTRVGRFQLDDTHREPNRPEIELQQALNDWREQLMAGASLKETNMQREWSPSVFRHQQFAPASARMRKPAAERKRSDFEDDHHSPVKPPDYIQMRLKVMMRFYQHRIPVYTRRRFLFKLAVLVLGVLSSILAQLGSILQLVTIVAALASALTSWSEFSDAGSKIDRYSAAVSALKQLNTRWDAMHEVQKQSKEVITHLVQRTELIIAEEQASWTSSIANTQTRDAFERGARQDLMHETTGSAPREVVTV